MTEHQKTAIQEAADKFASIAKEQYESHSGFIAGSTEVITNPNKYDLVNKFEASDHLEESDQNWTEALADLKAENQRYKEALMKTANTHDAAIEMDPAGIALKMRDAARQALKGESK